MEIIDIANLLFQERFNSIFWLCVLLASCFGFAKWSQSVHHPIYLQYVLSFLLLMAFVVGFFPFILWVNLLILDVSATFRPTWTIHFLALLGTGLSIWMISQRIELKKLPGFQSFGGFAFALLLSAFSVLFFESHSLWKSYVVGPWQYLLAFTLFFVAFRQMLNWFLFLMKKSNVDL